jgi:serine/threonine protein phosphatase PrpC
VDVSAAETVAACPSCGQPIDSGDAFCEACGTELAPALVSTGAPDFTPSCPVCSVDPSLPQPVPVTADGYCENCGRKVPTGRDHVELDLGPLAGVTDRGSRHPRNEDAMALATAVSPGGGPVAIAVVSDGVSSSPRPDEASLAGTQAGVRVLLDEVRMGSDPRDASLDAVRAAATALAELASPRAGGAPSATYVSAIVSSSEATICWLGDSRAYWLTADDSRRLTTDDSVAQEMVTSGLLDEAAALSVPQAHVITRWLGADIPDPEPHVVTFRPPGPGVVLICTDGLWNYLPEAVDLAAHAMPAAVTDPLGASSDLVKFALDAGGMDNITVVLVPFPLRSVEAHE